MWYGCGAGGAYLRRAFSLLFGLLSIFALAGCLPQPKEQDPGINAMIVQGTFSYRERIALLPGATAVVELRDVSRMDAEAPLIAEQAIALDGRSVPLPFALTVDSTQLNIRHRYAISVRILSPTGALMFTSDQTHLINNAARKQTLENILLVRVGGSRQRDVNTPLADSRWRVQSLEGEAVNEPVKMSLSFDDNGRVSGSAGCNRFTGKYDQRRQGRLRFDGLATTRRACVPSVQAQEQQFLRVLGEVHFFAIDTERAALHLMTSKGGTPAVVATRVEE